MNLFLEQIKGSIHHAYFVLSDSLLEVNLMELFDIKGYSSLEINKNFFIIENKTFDMNSAEELKSLASLKSAYSPSVFLIKINSINPEAGNALLKLLEEPSKDLFFFFQMPKGAFIMDTLKSRTHILRDDSDNNLDIDVIKFIKMGTSQRIDFVNEIVEKYKGEDVSLLRAFATDFVKALINLKRKDIPQDTKVMNLLLECLRFLGSNGSSPKMILEQLALVL